MDKQAAGCYRNASASFRSALLMREDLSVRDFIVL